MEKKSSMKKITGSREALLAVILILLCLVVTAISPSFLTPKSIIELLKNMRNCRLMVRVGSADKPIIARSHQVPD